MSLTKLIVVVDADCDVHDYARGRLAGVRQRRLRPRPAAHRRARSTTSTTPRTSSSGAARPASTRPGSCPRRATRAAAGRTRCVHGPGDVVATGRPALEGVRPVTATDRRRDRRQRPAPGQGRRVPAAGDDRALGLRAAVRLPRRADRDVRADGSVHWVHAAAGHGRDGRRAHLRDGRQPDHRPAASTPATRAPPSRELVTGAVSRAHGLDRRAASRWSSSSAPRPR